MKEFVNSLTNYLFGLKSAQNGGVHMRSLISDEDFNQAVFELNEKLSTQLVKEILKEDFKEEFWKLLCNGKNRSKQELCEILVEERGIELFAGRTEVVRKMRERFLKTCSEESIRKLYARYPTKDKKIESVGYMRKELAKKRWVQGKGYTKAFVKMIGFPEVFAGMAGDKIGNKEAVEEIQPKEIVPQLQPYQIKMKNHLLDILNGESKNKNCMLSLPTGGGKTRVAVEAFLEWMERRFEEERYLVWIAQSEELCEQCISCIEQLWRSKEFILPLKVYRYFANYIPKWEELTGGVFICSIQKLYSQIGTDNVVMVEHILSHTGAMIIDEAHRASTKIYDTLRDTAEKVTAGKMFPICGLSATPGRTKIEEEGKKLVNIFEANLIVPEFEEENAAYREHPLQYFKDKKYLSLTKHVMYRGNTTYQLTEKELEKMGTDNEAEYPSLFLKRIASNAENNRRILEKLRALPKDQPTLIYTCTVEQSKFLAMYMVHKGYKAAYIASDTGKNIRRKTIQEFKNGNIQYLFNYGVLTTGFDAPKVENIVLARPIRSEILYEQIIGRGIRGKEFGGTEFCTIIDFFDNSLIQGVPQSFERFQKYWDYDENNKELHPASQKKDNGANILYVINKLKRCPFCDCELTNGLKIYQKEMEEKRLMIRKCNRCDKGFVSEKQYVANNFPKKFFECKRYKLN